MFTVFGRGFVLPKSIINKEWIGRLVGESNFGGVPKRSAKMASLMDALAWEEANLLDIPYFGAYVDCSKCFDTLRYADLLRVSRSLGLSDKILAPLGGWYFHHRRRILVGGWLQEEIRPERGIPQGCPLSVTMAIVWSLTFSSRAERLLASEGQAQWTCVTYLDDFSFTSSSLEKLQVCLGWCQRHFAEWGVCLNLDKSSLLTNGKEPHQPEQLQLLDAKECVLLGVGTGWSVGNSALALRVVKAKRIAERALQLHLPQGLFQRITSIFIQPLLYGSEFCEDVRMLSTFDHSLRVPLWGKARTAANWSAIMALDLPAHTCTAVGSRFQRSFATTWSSSMLPTMRRRILALWTMELAPRPGGAWACFLSLLVEAGLRLLPGGAICLSTNEELFMHLSMPTTTWMHQARVAWRYLHLWRAHQQVPMVFPHLPHYIDWTLTCKPNGLRSPMLSTTQTNGLNTKSRVHRHFGMDCGISCEHGCLQPDSSEHRITECVGLRQAREEIGISPEEMAYFVALHHCHRRAAIWLLPVGYIPWRLPLQEAWRLWPSQEWLAQVNEIGILEEPIELDCRYLLVCQGRHPSGAPIIREEVYPGKNPENQFSVELFEACASKKTWAMSGGGGVCFSGAPTGMDCLLLVLWRNDPQVRLSMDES